MFFVISGFCITASARSTIRKSEGTANFLWRRFRRIYPPFWFSIAVVAALPFCIEILSALKTGIYHAPTSKNNINYGFLKYDIFEWMRLATLTQALWPVENVRSLQEKFTSINAVYWTLAIEVQFYCIVAIALNLSRKRFYWTLAFITAICLPFSIMDLLLASGLFIPFWPMFAVGGFLFFVLDRGWSLDNDNFRPSKFASVIAVFILITGIMSFMIAASRGFNPSWLSFSAFFAICMWLVKPQDKWFNHMVDNRHLKYFIIPFITLGAMSYSAYLLHGKLQFLTAQLARQVLEVDSIKYDVSVIVSTLILCYPFYVYCESPFFKSKPS